MADLSQEIWATQLEKDNNALIIDVRTENEAVNGIIPNAKIIDIYQAQQFMSEIEALDKSMNYYVYCRSGARSAQACAIMNQIGIQNAYNLIGGFIKWRGEVADI